MSDEKFLIECASLSSSAATRSPRGPGEDSLIAHAVLAKCETDYETSRQQGQGHGHGVSHLSDQKARKTHGIEHETQTPHSHGHRQGNIPEVVLTKFADADDDEDVFQDAECDKTVQGFFQVYVSPRTEEQRRIQLTEDILIKYAHLSENELQEMLRKHEEDENRHKKMISGRKAVLIPKLDIGNVSDDNVCEPEKDGYITPANSMADDDTRKRRVSDQYSMTAAVHRTPSPRGSKLDEEEPVDVDFNKLIVDTANAMTASDFEDIKAMLQDTEGFDIFVRQDSPILFLNHLRRYKLISPDNMQHLQAVITRLRNPLLQARARQYMKHKFQTVVFYPETRHIPIGFGTFKCHVSGKDFTRLKRHDLESLRSTVSLLLFVPSNCVYITSIEPGINLVVSLMIPQRYMGTLMKMATDGLPELAGVGVDLVQISGRTIKTHALVPTITSANDHMRFLTVYQQLREKNEQLEEKDREIVSLKEDTEFIKLELETKNAEIEMLTEKLPHNRFHHMRRHRSAERCPRTVVQRSPPRSLADKNTKKDAAATRPTNEVKVIVPGADAGGKPINAVKEKRERQSRAGNRGQISEERTRPHRHGNEASHEFEWIRDDTSALSGVRQIIEREEIMSDIESILTELGVPTSPVMLSDEP